MNTPVATSCSGCSCESQRCAGRAAQRRWGQVGGWGTEPCGWSPCSSGRRGRGAAGPEQCGTGTPHRPCRTRPKRDRPGPAAETYCTEWRSCGGGCFVKSDVMDDLWSVGEAQNIDPFVRREHHLLPFFLLYIIVICNKWLVFIPVSTYFKINSFRFNLN